MRPLALNPPRHQKAHAGIVFPALSKMLFACEWGMEMPSRLTDRLPAYVEAIGQHTGPGYVLILLHLGRTLKGISQTATDALD